MNGWYSVIDRPLYTVDKNGNWVCTEDGERSFIACVPYNDSNRPGDDLWWIHHCVIEDGIGLCVVGEDDNQAAGWSLQDVAFWKPFPHVPPLTEHGYLTSELIKKHFKISLYGDLKHYMVTGEATIQLRDAIGDMFMELSDLYSDDGSADR